MHRKVAVEKNLNNVKQYFVNQGYHVDLFDDTQIDRIFKVSNYDAVIASGGNINFMGIQDTSTNIPIIDASSLSPEDIFNQVNGRFQ